MRLIGAVCECRCVSENNGVGVRRGWINEEAKVNVGTGG